MIEDKKKPRRHSRRGQSSAAPVSDTPVDPDDVSRSEHNEVTKRNEKSSAELLRLLTLCHRHGYGEYNVPPIKDRK